MGIQPHAPATARPSLSAESITGEIDGFCGERGWEFTVAVFTAMNCTWECTLTVVLTPDRDGGPDRSLVTFATGGDTPDDAIRDAWDDMRGWLTQAPPELRVPASPPPALAALRAEFDGWLVVLLGAPGAGKSALAAATWPAGHVLSLDRARLRIAGDECDQDATPDAVAVVAQLAAMRLGRGLTTVIDATNVTAAVRRPLLELAAVVGRPAVAVAVLTPLAECLARNAARPGPAAGQRYGRRVPDGVVRDYHDRVTASVPYLRGEGFAAVVTYDGTTVLHARRREQ